MGQRVYVAAGTASDLNLGAGTFELQSAAGNERKTTGSYYTEPGLVNELIESALEPVIQARLAERIR